MYPADTILLQCSGLKAAPPLAQLAELKVKAVAYGMRAYRENDSGETYAYFDLAERRELTAADLRSLEEAAAALWPDAALQTHALKRVQYMEGAGSGQPVGIHYVVEMEFDPAVAGELTRWYAFEHLPGLASVPGCVRAQRYLDQSGRSFGCYDLVSADVPRSAEWMKWRDSEWTVKLREHFRNMKRGLYRAVMS
jgi:hypothetical protein